MRIYKKKEVNIKGLIEVITGVGLKNLKEVETGKPFSTPDQLNQ